MNHFLSTRLCSHFDRALSNMLSPAYVSDGSTASANFPAAL